MKVAVTYFPACTTEPTLQKRWPLKFHYDTHYWNP